MKSIYEYLNIIHSNYKQVIRFFSFDSDINAFLSNRN